MCRLVYELAQAKHRGADRFWSIDDTYWVPGGRPVYERVKHDHKPLRQAESEVTKGDVVEFLENHWDGYALISFPKQNQTGLIPAIKIDNIPKMYNYSSKINA